MYSVYVNVSRFLSLLRLLVLGTVSCFTGVGTGRLTYLICPVYGIFWWYRKGGIRLWVGMKVVASWGCLEVIGLVRM